MIKAYSKLTSFLTKTVILCIIAAISYFGFKYFEKEIEMQKLREKVENMKKALENITGDYPIANIVVLSRESRPDGIYTQFRIEFVNESGISTTPAKEYEIEGEMLYFEGLLMVFGQDWVAEGSRKSLLFPTRLYTEKIPPVNGIKLNILDNNGVPVLYREDSTELEDYKKALKDFWFYANTPSEAQKLKIDIMQGQAVFTKYDIKRYYTIYVQNAGGMLIKPMPIRLN